MAGNSDKERWSFSLFEGTHWSTSPIYEVDILLYQAVFTADY